MVTPHPGTTVVNVEDTGLAAISLTSKIPDFWTDQPRVWFIRIEAMLGPQKLADQAKFDIVVSKLGKEVLEQITDLLINPPDTAKYEALKTRLLNIYEESENRKIQKLIGEMELGDQKPSQLLRRMKDLATGKITEETLSILWQNLLPTSVRAVLAATETKDLNRLAAVADKILENTRPLQVTEITPQVQGDIAMLTAQIAKLCTQVTKLERGRSRERNTNRLRQQQSSSRRRTPSRPRRTPESPDWLCYYHFKFRNKAAKCVQPCSWRKETQEN